jgi:CPA2 family monovalent cation:H+ antiporter-2
MHPQLFVILLLLTAAVGAVSVVRRFRMPSMLAYLAIGIVMGPHGLAILAESAEVESFAEFGIVFLMFSIGLEFSLKRLQAMRSLVFGFGSAQMVLTALGTGLATAMAYDQGWRSGIAVGLAVAMSSTAIVAKMLSDRFELHSRSGRQTMGVLLFQDLAVAPCLILLPALAASGDDLLRSLAVAAAQAVAVLALLIWLGQKLMTRIFDAAAKVRSNELLVLTTLWIVIGLSFLTAQSGLSLALGAFVGGMLISETVYRHHVEADIRPFRDILLGLFFVTVGMMLDIHYVLANAHKLVLAVALLIGGKAAVVLFIAHLAKTPAGGQPAHRRATGPGRGIRPGPDRTRAPTPVDQRQRLPDHALGHAAVDVHCTLPDRPRSAPVGRPRTRRLGAQGRGNTQHRRA